MLTALGVPLDVADKRPTAPDKQPVSNEKASLVRATKPVAFSAEVTDGGEGNSPARGQAAMTLVADSGQMRCGAVERTEYFEELEVVWDDGEKRYSIRASGSEPEDRVELASLPVEIANTSRCSCGAALHLGDHGLRMESGGFSLVAEYYCDECENRKSLLHRIRGALTAAFKRTKRVRIAASGIEVEAK